MKKILVTLSFIGLICNYWAQTTTSFRKNYDVSLFDIPMTSIEGLTPNTYVFSGFHAFSSSITAVDNVGVTTWSKRFSNGISLYIGDVKKDVSLNRYYACGGDDTGPAFLMFLDASGNLISGRNFSIDEADGASFNRVIKTSDGGYLCVGTVTGYDPDGGGAEVKFNSVTNNDAGCDDPHTEFIQSPLIVKFDASGNHLWHQVFRYYTTSATPANRIYNDASFVDVIEISDGYIAVGNYDVNNVFSDFDPDDCDDTTPTDAMIIKTNKTDGSIIYHRQIDNPSNSTSQTNKSFNSASLTAAGLPLISGLDGNGRPMMLMRFAGSGGFANPTWIRKYRASSFIGANPFEPGRFFETSDGNYAVWGFHINTLAFNFSNVLMKINTTGGVQWSREYSNGLATILPHGQQTSDDGFIGLAYTLAGTGHNLHFIKTDPEGRTSTDCPEADLTVSSETPSYTWGTPIYNAWNANTVNNGAFNPTVTNITPTESIQCLTVVTACTPPSAPTTVTATPATICPGESSSITASGPSDPNVNYNVYDAATGGTNLGATPLTVSPTSTTSYWVEAVDNTDPNCVSTTRTEVVVTVNDGPTVSNAGEDQTICGTSTTLEGNTAAVGTGTWTVVSGSGTFADANNPTTTVSGLGNGVNVFRWTISNPPCPDSFDEVSITSVAAPTVATAGDDQSLCATSTTLEGNTPAVGTGTWTVISGSGTFADANNPTTTVSGLGNGANVFQWTITNAPCPASSDQVTITNTGGPTTALAGDDQTICGTSATLEGNTAAVGTGTWTVVSGSGTFADANNPTTTVSGLSAGANVFQWTIANDPCVPSSDQVTINAVETPTTALAGDDQSICSTSTTLEGNTPTIGTGTWTVISGSGTFADANNPTTTVSGLGLGDNIFQWTISNAPCAPSSDQVTITNTGGPTINIVSTSDVSCNGGNDGEATVSATGGVEPYNYSWSPTGGSNATATGLTPGDYTVTVTDDIGCLDNILVTIGEPTAISLDVSSTPSSCATPDGTATVVANGGNGPYTYAWSPSGGNADVAAGLASGDYTVTVTDANLCEASTSVTVGVSDGPVIAVESTVDATCNGGSNGSAEISVTGGTGNYTYSWSPSGGSAATATDLSSGDYTVTVEDEAGCIATENITIGEPDALSVTADIVNATCSGDDGSISLTVTGGTANYSYEWQPNGETTSTITGNAGSYNVTVTDANNCEITEAYTIGLTDNLQATVDPEITTIEGGESVDVVVTIDPDVDNVTYTWTPTEGLSCSDCPNPTASPSETTTYEVVVIADNGCNDTAQVTIIVTTPCGDIFMPTIFSPNADGLNDELCLLGNCITELDLKIYDRWGELVFETTDPSFCWDGSFRGKPMNSAVFVYKLLVRTTDGQEVEESGNVNLVR